MNSIIRQRIEQGRLVIFLGAGASIGCTDGNGKAAAPLGEGLKKILADASGIPDCEDEDLQDTYVAASKILGRQLQNILDSLFSGLNPSERLLEIASYPWPRVYTTNIDDAFVSALDKKSKQKINVRSRDSAASPISEDLSGLDVIFLNGYVNRPNDGYIFSSMEYARAQASDLPWFRQLVRDFFDCTFMFIGTKIKESTLYYHLALHAQTQNSAMGKSFVLSPAISRIQKERLGELNIEHIEGTLDDFTNWLKKEFPSGLSREAILKERVPYLRLIDKDKIGNIDLGKLKDVQIINREFLPKPNVPIEPGVVAHEFYKGFKPNWADIVGGVPAELDDLIKLLDEIKNNKKKLIVLIGPAGSGKTTLLMQCAFKLHELNKPVYYIDGATDDLRSVVDALEKIHQCEYFLFIQRISNVDRQVRRCLQDNLLTYGRIISVDRDTKWISQSRELLEEFEPKVARVHTISENDADKILDKLNKYSPAVGLLRMGRKERKKVLLEKSKRQLLIGLLEATYGIGYKRLIIEEYESLDEELRAFVSLIGLATYFDIPVSKRIIESILREKMGNPSLDQILTGVAGIVRLNDNKIYARHPVYVREILKSLVARDHVERSLRWMLEYFASLPTPLGVHRNQVGHQIVHLFKKLINHSFVRFVLQEPDRVVRLYRGFEKDFHGDGLFWLQMGLAYRGINKHEEALHAFQTGLSLHPIEHTKHALAQQKLINASVYAANKDVLRARAFMEDGVSELNEMDKFDSLVGGRYYPIVALSEGHVFVLRELDGEDKAKEYAKRYADELSARLANDGVIFRGRARIRLAAPQIRAKKTLQRLNRYVLDNKWEFGRSLAVLMTTDLPASQID